MAFYPNAGALRLSVIVRAALAGCEVRLYKDGEVEPGPSTTLADLDAAQCDFDGYAPIVITNFNLPGLVPGGGAGINASVQFRTDDAIAVGNAVGGYYLVIQGSPDEVFVIQPFVEPILMQAAGQIIPITQLLLFGTPG